MSLLFEGRRYPREILLWGGGLGCNLLGLWSLALIDRLLFHLLGLAYGPCCAPCRAFRYQFPFGIVVPVTSVPRHLLLVDVFARGWEDVVVGFVGIPLPEPHSGCKSL